MNKKILITTGIFPPDIGGPASYVVRLASEFTEKGYQVEVVTYGEEEKDEEYDFSVRRVSRKKKLPFRYFSYFLQVLLAGRDASVVYAQCPVSSGWSASWAAKILRKKFILKIVGDYAWEQARNIFEIEDSLDDFQKKSYSGKIAQLRKIQKKTAQRAQAIIVPSLYLKSIVQDWGIDQSKIKVVYNAIEENPLVKKINQQEAKERTGLWEDIILSIGRLVPWKGFDVLIDSFSEILEKNPNFRLVIIGSGPQKENLIFKIKNKGLKGKVLILDPLPHSELVWYMKAADMFVLNTSYEGLPHIILEAMQCGLPIITTRVGGNLEIIENEQNGLLIEPNQKDQITRAILRIWQSHQLKYQLTKNASLSLDEFSFDKMINQTLEILL